MKKVIVFTLFILFFSCANKLAKYKDDSDCNTVIVGKFLNAYPQPRKEPCLILKDKNDYKKIYGKIIEIRETGMVFDQKDDGLYTPGPKFFDYSNIKCAINDSGKVIYGLPSPQYCYTFRIYMKLRKIDTTDQKLINIQFEPNEKFSYCINPGEYTIEEFLFQNNDYSKEYFKKLPQIKFNIQEGFVNDLGLILIDLVGFPEPNSHLLRASKIELPPNVFFVGGPLLFTLLSAPQVLFNGTKTNGLHTIQFRERDIIEFSTKTPTKNVKVEFEPSDFEVEVLKQIQALP